MAAAWRSVMDAEMPDEWAESRRLRNSPAALAEMRRLHPEIGGDAEYHVGVEIPDFPVAREWFEWMLGQPQQGLAGVMVTPREQWRDRPQD